MLCQRLAVKIRKTERYWIAISLGRFVGKKTGLLFLHYRLLAIFRFFYPFLPLSRYRGADNFNEEAKRSFKKEVPFIGRSKKLTKQLIERIQGALWNTNGLLADVI